MSTSENIFGSNIYPGTVVVLPDALWHQSGVKEVVDEDGNVTMGSLSEYLASAGAAGASIKAREVRPLPCGTHSFGVFETDKDDEAANVVLAESAGLVEIDRPFDAYRANGWAQMPIWLFVKEFLSGAYGQGQAS